VLRTCHKTKYAKIRKLQERLVKCWLIQSVFSGNCAEEENSQQNFE